MNVAGNLALGVAKFSSAPLMGDWVARAACAGLAPELFHPHRGVPTDRAKAVCQACPVRTDCLDYALRTNQKFGIWGGTTERTRRRLHHADRESAPLDRQCPCCGAAFRARRVSQRFCSADCRNHHRATWGRL